MNAYKISVMLELVNRVTPGLSSLSRSLGASEKDVERLQHKFDKMKASFASGFVVGAVGVAGLEFLKKPIEAAEKYQNELSKIAVMGYDQKEQAQAVAMAWKSTHEAQSMGVTQALATYRELRPLLKDSQEVANILPQVGRVAGVVQAFTGKAADHVGFDLVKAIELTQRGVMNEVDLKRKSDLMTKTIIGMGGTVDVHDFHMALKMAKTQSLKFNDDFTYNYLPTLIQELKTGKGGAATAGTVLNAGYRMIVNQEIGKEMIPGWVDAGLIARASVIKDKHDHGSKVRANSIAGERLYEESPYMWGQQYLLPAYKRYAALHKGANIEEFVSTLTKQGNKAWLLNTLLEKSAQFERDKANIQKGLSSEKAYKQLLTTNPELAKEALHQQWDNLKLKIGMVVLPKVMVFLGKMTDFIEKVTVFTDKHPSLTKFAVGGIAVTSMALVAGGAMLMLSGALRGLGLAADAIFTIAKFPLKGGGGAGGVSRITRAVRTLLSHSGMFINVIRGVGRALVMTPIGRTLMLVGMAAIYVYKHWSQILPRLQQVWAIMKSVFYQALDAIKGVWQNHFTWLKTAIAVGVGCLGGLTGALQSVWNWISRMISGITSIPDNFLHEAANRAGHWLDHASVDAAKINAAHEHPTMGSPNIHKGALQPIVVEHTSYHDGHAIFKSTTKYMAKAASRAPASIMGFDGSMHMPNVGFST